MAKILIVEDEKYTRDTLSFVLENSGYRIIDASDGLEALQIAFDSQKSKDPIDIVILDIELPGLTGFKIIEMLRHHNLSIPILAITGLMDTPTFDNIANKGCIECLMKPFNPETIRERIHNMVQIHVLQKNTESYR